MTARASGKTMLVSMKIAGFTPSEADTLRKGMGKKEPEKIFKLRDKFIKGCINRGIEKDVAEKIFDNIEKFGGYGFNKCLSGSTKVFNKVDEKTHTLKELCENKDIKLILDSYIAGRNIEDEVIDIFETGEKEIYKVELSNGMTIECTLDHKFICSDGKKYTIKEILDNDMNIIYKEDK